MFVFFLGVLGDARFGCAGGPRGGMRGQDRHQRVVDGGEVMVRRATGWVTEEEVVCDWCGPAYVL